MHPESVLIGKIGGRLRIPSLHKQEWKEPDYRCFPPSTFQSKTLGFEVVGFKSDTIEQLLQHGEVVRPYLLCYCELKLQMISETKLSLKCFSV